MDKSRYFVQEIKFYLEIERCVCNFAAENKNITIMANDNKSKVKDSAVFAAGAAVGAAAYTALDSQAMAGEQFSPIDVTTAEIQSAPEAEPAVEVEVEVEPVVVERPHYSAPSPEPVAVPEESVEVVEAEVDQVVEVVDSQNDDQSDYVAANDQTVDADSGRTVNVNGADLEIVGYERVTNDDGSQMDVATAMADEGAPILFVDTDLDSCADVAICDMDGDGNITENEVIDIRDHQVDMHPMMDAADFSAEYAAGDMPDYVNDADVDSYMS